MENPHDSVLQFPQRFLCCNDVHFKWVSLGGNILLQLFHALKEDFNNFVLLQ